MKKTVKPEKKIELNQFLKLLRDPNRFKKIEDGWVRDSLLGIEWGPSSAEEMTWAKAKDYCANLGGRLPEVNELQSLVDYSRRDPVIDTTFFKDTKSSWYWTGTEVAGGSTSAWCVRFSYGYVGNFNKGNGYYVRPVRASQC